MLRSDYDNHPLWGTLHSVDERLRAILDAHSAGDLASIERIRIQEEYVRSFDVVASTRVAFFHSAMLDAVNVVWQQVLNSLDHRVSMGLDYSNYVTQAADQAETGLLQMSAWPRAYGRGGEVTQMNTLFEELLEAQRISVEALRQEHDGLRAELSEYSVSVDEKRSEVLTAIGAAEADVDSLRSQIDQQKSVVEDSVLDARRAIKALTAQNEESFAAWKVEREAAFIGDFEGLRDQISDKLTQSSVEYEELLSAKEKYTKLVSAIAADEVAFKFETEARWGRVAGIALYIAGFALLAGAAVPLILLIAENAQDTATGINWTPIVIRLSVGVLAGSAATVAIRLGGRFITNANSAKRMELELRAIGPFLANVADPSKVDDARIELVGKAFGKTYGEGGHNVTRDKDEMVSVTTASQLLDLASRMSKLS